jgi:hypothetical protein
MNKLKLFLEQLSDSELKSISKLNYKEIISGNWIDIPEYVKVVKAIAKELESRKKK